jgi:DNA-binding NarL/FixJ family response regulator
MSDKKIKIAIADDHKIIREGMSALIMCIPEFEVTAAAAEGDELLLNIEKYAPDVVLMDIQMPGKSGIELAKILKEKYPKIKTIIFSGNITEAEIIPCMESGVKGIISKNSGIDEIKSAVFSVMNGNEFFGESITSLILQSFIKSKDKQSGEKQKNLSSREVEIIRCFAEGLSYKEIADKLSISARTVESHKNHIMKKMEFKTLTDLVKYAIRNRFIELD